VGDDVNPEVFRAVGQAYGTLIRRRGADRIAVGQDNRLSSGDLKAAFMAGARAAGLGIVDIGLSPTPVLYFATAHWKLDGGANITGSHNPIEYNGVKMMHAGSAPLTEDEIQSLRAMIEAGDLASGGARSPEPRSARDDYFAAVAERVRPARRLKIVVDAGNGVASLYAPDLLRRLGCDVIELYCESDGSFPNHLPDPEDPENMVDLQARVVETGADLGVAYDGDADRVGIVDDRGRRHEADLILVLLARDLLARHPGAKILFDVKSSQSLIDDVRAHGGVPVMWKTGHSHLKRKMREDSILLGGEVSGHMFFAENYYGVDDGILASCKIIELTAASPVPISRHFATIPHLRATPELKAPCPDGEKFRVVEEVTRELKQLYETIDIDGARVIFPGRGWGLVRASNTNPYLTLRFEAHTDAEISEMKRAIYGALQRYPFVTLPA
jgi:phosphomannomutase/phosphoglucomutase